MIAGKILLVDDDEDDQLIFKDALRETSFAVDCVVASNGLDGLHVLSHAAELPAMIFLDLNMPIMNGVEFLTRIKQNPLYNNIPVIIFSTSNNPIDKQRLPKLGASQFITKSGDFQKLKEKLVEILND